MALRNQITEKLFFPLSDIVLGSSVSKHLKFLQKSQHWTRSQIDEYQNQRLKKLIHHSYENVPFYRELFDNLKLKPVDIQTKDDLKKLPIVTKDDLRRNKGKHLASNIKKKELVFASSSGSTGEPLTYFTTKDAYSMNIASNLRGWYWMGFRLGDKYIKLSQNLRKAPLKKIQDYLSNNLYLATNPLTDENFEFICKEIERYQPKIVRCYPDPLVFLAKYKKNKPDFSFQPLAITTTGNTLFPEARKEIEEAFGCKVFDAYSCEGNSTVFECPTHTGYHSSEEYGITEVLDDDGNQITKGVGRLISTDLWNLAHPFIRYDTQDLVEVTDEPCSCGRNHLRVKRIVGRNNDIIKTKKNRFIVHSFTSFFTRQDLPTFGKIEKFQVRKQEDHVLFILVVNSLYNNEIEQFIIQYWENEMGIKVLVEIQSEIPLTQSGKHRFIIND